MRIDLAASRRYCTALAVPARRKGPSNSRPSTHHRHLRAEALEKHGGAPGLRNRGVLEAALCMGVRREHPFADGNMRAGLLASPVTLGLDGLALGAVEREAAAKVTAAASGELDEAEFPEQVARNSHETPEDGGGPTEA